MPRLWTDTIESHRGKVRETIVAVTARLVEQHGLLGVTMAQVADESGIGRATLYKYFPDLESILLAWHEGAVSSHVEQLANVAHSDRDAFTRLRAVLSAYAQIEFGHHGDHLHDAALAAALHRGAHVDRATGQLHALLRDLIEDAAKDGVIRSDLSAEVLARFCIYALGAANGTRRRRDVDRLVGATIAGLSPA